MIPLRLPLEEEKVDSPVTAIKVEDGYNNEKYKDINVLEADAIVDDIYEIVHNPKYQDQTIGVITLQGNKQHRFLENLIKDKIKITEQKYIDDNYSRIKQTQRNNLNFEKQQSLFAETADNTHQMFSNKGRIDNSLDNSWLTDSLTSKDLNYIDKRDKGGSLWGVGGVEIKSIFKEHVNNEIYFQFTPRGSRSTKNQLGWYMK